MYKVGDLLLIVNHRDLPRHYNGQTVKLYRYEKGASFPLKTKTLNGNYCSLKISEVLKLTKIVARFYGKKCE